MTSALWSLTSVGVLIPTAALHNWTNAQRRPAFRGAARAWSARWWFPWPRRAEFPDVRTWRLAQLAQVLIYLWTAATLAVLVWW